MADSAAFVITIDGVDHQIPDDLDLNDVAALEDEGWSLDNMGSMKAIRFLVWRLLRRQEPDITLEEAGSKVPLSMFLDKAEVEAEGPPPVPLSVPDHPSGTSGEESSGNGSTGISAVTAIHGATGVQ